MTTAGPGTARGRQARIEPHLGDATDAASWPDYPGRWRGDDPIHLLAALATTVTLLTTGCRDDPIDNLHSYIDDEIASAAAPLPTLPDFEEAG